MKRYHLYIHCFIFIQQSVTSQSLYQRDWGTLLSVYKTRVVPFTASEDKLIRPPYLITEVNSKTEKLYVVGADGNDIYEFDFENAIPKLIFKIPDGKTGGSYIEQIKQDHDGNLIISGRTTNEFLATPGAYSQNMIYGMSLRVTFISKISLSGHLLWSTYFHDLTPNTSHLTIDAANNIYFLNKRNKATIAHPSHFQATGNSFSSNEYQDVISKLNSEGEHIWSTFYTKDASTIRSIVAGDTGLYVYGDHLGGASESSYFGTPNSFQPKLSTYESDSNNLTSVFLTKFSFEGERIWSTYFSNHSSSITLGATLKNNNSMVVINDEPYILTTHRRGPHSDKVLVTEGAYLSDPKKTFTNTTLSRFSSDGDRIWTTFIEAGEHVFSNGKELFVSTSLFNASIKNEKLITTKNAYQEFHGGNRQDAYTAIYSLDGKQLKYASFYGYDGRDEGVTLPTATGYYVIGKSNFNTSSESLFVTDHAPKVEYIEYNGNYLGDFLSYFKRKKETN